MIVSKKFASFVVARIEAKHQPYCIAWSMQGNRPANTWHVFKEEVVGIANLDKTIITKKWNCWNLEVWSVLLQLILVKSHIRMWLVITIIYLDRFSTTIIYLYNTTAVHSS